MWYLHWLERSYHRLFTLLPPWHDLLLMISFFFSAPSCVPRRTPFIFFARLWASESVIFSMDHFSSFLSPQCIQSRCCFGQNERRKSLFLIFTFPWASQSPLVSSHMYYKQFQWNWKIQPMIYCMDIVSIGIMKLLLIRWLWMFARYFLQRFV